MAKSKRVHQTVVFEDEEDQAALLAGVLLEGTLPPAVPAQPTAAAAPQQDLPGVDQDTPEELPSAIPAYEGDDDPPKDAYPPRRRPDDDNEDDEPERDPSDPPAEEEPEEDPDDEEDDEDDDAGIPHVDPTEPHHPPAATNASPLEPSRYTQRIRVLEAYQYKGKLTDAPAYVDRSWAAYGSVDPLRDIPAGPAVAVPDNLGGSALARIGDYIVRQSVTVAEGIEDTRVEVWSRESFEKFFLPIH